MREIDKLLAEKVMGWESYNWPVRQGDGYWSPTTDIIAAWNVLEKVMEQGALFRFDVSQLRSTENNKPFAQASIWTATDDDAGIPVLIARGQAESVPMAICKAVLVLNELNNLTRI